MRATLINLRARQSCMQLLPSGRSGFLDISWRRTHTCLICVFVSALNHTCQFAVLEYLFMYTYTYSSDPASRLSPSPPLARSHMYIISFFAPFDLNTRRNSPEYILASCAFAQLQMWPHLVALWLLSAVSRVSVVTAIVPWPRKSSLA